MTLKFVCCNADEGRQRHLRGPHAPRGDPFSLLEALTIAAYAVGASEGYVYVRSSTPTPSQPCAGPSTWPGRRLLRRHIAGREGFTFDLTCGSAPGPYICGEETSMLDSLEGKRGEVRAKPPILALVGSLASRPSSTTSCRSRPSR